ncbi:hypothetical protein SKAU_G00415210 [Synaphobranchus kaupii]|uniref:Phospholipid-transporting ATPase IIB n=1 Tax=Synaphobranchus kaupii TaxID=118154 RepID=A0A9Q1E765_SYNKA|nr:hypothetical protein SKAU_G00415210 [Synaphobranchus kaupii]
MGDSIQLQPLQKNSKKHVYYNAGNHNRYQVEDEATHLDEMPLMMSEEGFGNDESDYHTLPRVRVNQRQRGLGWFLLGSWKLWCSSCCDWLPCTCCRKKDMKARTVWLGCPEKCKEKYPKNAIKNQKYNVFTFIPGVLYQQFKFFLNLYFLVVACSQFVPSLQVGYLYTYWAPLGLVLAVTMIREAVDEVRRYRRDKEMNSQLYSKLTVQGKIQVRSCDIQIGDLIIVEKNQRIPADLVFLRTTEKTGACFIRTDQLDGETDWKLKVAVACTQRLPALGDLFSIIAYVYAQKPQLDIHSFEGNFTREDSDPSIHESLCIENTLWASTVVASGTVIGVVVYTGKETRSVLNTSHAKNKIHSSQGTQVPKTHTTAFQRSSHRRKGERLTGRIRKDRSEAGESDATIHRNQNRGKPSTAGAEKASAGASEVQATTPMARDWRNRPKTWVLAGISPQIRATIIHRRQSNI